MPKVKCAYCGKEIQKDLYHFNRSKNFFCCIKHKSLFQQKSNKIINNSDYAELIINNIVVKIDIEDIDKINKLCWHLKFDKTIKGYYIHAWERNNYNNRKEISLHRYIMNTPKGLECDHINRNTLDNRKANLRNVLPITNKQNKGFYSNNKSGYKYIYWNKSNKTYVCEIKRYKKIIYRKSCKNLKDLVQMRDDFLKGVI